MVTASFEREWFFLPRNTRKSCSISSSLPWTSKSQRNRRDVASHHRSGEPLQVKHVWEEMLIMSQKLIFRLRGNLVSPKSTFPPFYSCFIQYFPCIKFQSKTQKRKKGVLNVGRAGVVAIACISAAGASTSTIFFKSTQINIARKPYKKIPRTQSNFSSKQFSIWCFFFCNKSVTYIYTSAKWYFPKNSFL